MVTIDEKLNSLKQEDYKIFSSKLVTSKFEILGVRLPELRSLAKSLPQSEFDSIEFKSFESVMLYGMALAKIKDIEILKQKLDYFLPFIDNWSVCDSTVSSLKIISKHKDELFNYFVNLLKSGKTYYMRFALVVFLTYYRSKEEIEKVLNLFPIQNSEYYVLMAVAWLNATYLIFEPELVKNRLNTNYFSKFVINKSISKAHDSFRLSKELKEELKGYRV